MCEVQYVICDVIEETVSDTVCAVQYVICDVIEEH